MAHVRRKWNIAGHQVEERRHDAVTTADVRLLSIAETEELLGVSKATLYRWLGEGIVIGEQVTPGAPWRIRADAALRSRIVGEAPDGWVGLDEAAKALDVARQTVLDRVRRGELKAVHVTRGRRKELAIELPPPQPQLFNGT